MSLPHPSTVSSTSQMLRELRLFFFYQELFSFLLLLFRTVFSKKITKVWLNLSGILLGMIWEHDKKLITMHTHGYLIYRN